jgi:hypothetical protein
MTFRKYSKLISSSPLAGAGEEEEGPGDATRLGEGASETDDMEVRESVVDVQ